MRSTTCSAVFVLALTFLTARATAAPSFGLSLGIGEYAALTPPAHGGVYTSWGVYVTTPISRPIVSDKRVSLTFTAGVEYAVDTGQWGFVPTLAIDVPVHDRVGIDLIVMFMHNQTGGRWDEAEFLLGAGPGLSIFLGDWSVSWNALVFRSLNLDGWAVFPGVGVSRSIP